MKVKQGVRLIAMSGALAAMSGCAEIKALESGFSLVIFLAIAGLVAAVSFKVVGAVRKSVAKTNKQVADYKQELQKSPPQESGMTKLARQVHNTVAQRMAQPKQPAEPSDAAREFEDRARMRNFDE